MTRAGKLNFCTIVSKDGCRSVGHSRYLSSIVRSLDRAVPGEIGLGDGDNGDDDDNMAIKSNTSSCSTKKLLSDVAVVVDDSILFIYSMAGSMAYINYQRHANLYLLQQYYKMIFYSILHREVY